MVWFASIVNTKGGHASWWGHGFFIESHLGLCGQGHKSNGYKFFYRILVCDFLAFGEFW